MSREPSPTSSQTGKESNRNNIIAAATGNGDVEIPKEGEMEVINLSMSTVRDEDINRFMEKKMKNVPFRKRKIGLSDDDEESAESRPSSEQTPSLNKPAKPPKAAATNADSNRAVATATESSFSLASAQANLNFPQRLRRAIDDEKNHEILRWLPHGLSFKVFEKEDFERIILPKYFQKQSKYWSFTRKLGRWGFVRITSGSESGSYQHPLFKRDEPDLISQMTCQSSAVGSSIMSATSPNFKLSQGQINLDDQKMPAMNKGGRAVPERTSSSLPTIEEVRRRANSQGAFTRDAGPAVNSAASHPLLQGGPTTGLQLDTLTEQQLLMELAARSSGTVMPTQSMLASLQAGAVHRGGPYRDFELLDERKKFLLSQELLRQQMQQNDESLLLRLMLENRRNQLPSASMGVQPPNRNIPSSILDNNRLSNLELLRMQVATAADSASSRNASAAAMMQQLSPPLFPNEAQDNNSSLLSFLASRSNETPQQGALLKTQQEQQQTGVSDDLAAQILHLQNLHRQQQQQQHQQPQTQRKPDQNDQQSDSSTK